MSEKHKRELQSELEFYSLDGYITLPKTEVDYSYYANDMVQDKRNVWFWKDVKRPNAKIGVCNSCKRGFFLNTNNETRILPKFGYTYPIHPDQPQSTHCSVCHSHDNKMLNPCGYPNL